MIVPLTVASREQSISELKWLTNHLRSSRSQERLKNVFILSNENEMCKNLDLEDMIRGFSVMDVTSLQENQ